MLYPQPPESKSAVRRAGKAISSGVSRSEDYEIVDKWRAAHGYVINTFQAWIKGHIEKKSYAIEFARRLKRRNRVVDKLSRRDSTGQLLIADVAAMHDFAGCRIIFENLIELNDFRAYMHSPMVTKNVKHVLRYPPEKYNYMVIIP